MSRKPLLALSALLLGTQAWAINGDARFVGYSVDQVLLPRYQTLAQDNTALKNSLAGLCATPGTPVSQAQKQWLTSYSSWMRVTALNWGPSATLRSQRTIAFRPARTSLVDDAIAKLAAKEAESDVYEHTGSAAKGYGSIEYLLFERSKTLATPADCQWLQLTSAEINTHSQQLLSQWQQLAARLRTGEPADDLPGKQQMLEEMFNLTLAGINELHKELSRISKQKADTITGQRSNSGKQLLQAQFSLLAALLASSNANDFALDRVLTANKQPDTLVKKLQQHVSAVNAGLARLPDNLATLGNSGREQATVKALENLLSTLEGPVADGLDITISFNESDGD